MPVIAKSDVFELHKFGCYCGSLRRDIITSNDVLDSVDKVQLVLGGSSNCFITMMKFLLSVRRIRTQWNSFVSDEVVIIS